LLNGGGIKVRVVPQYVSYSRANPHPPLSLAKDEAALRPKLTREPYYSGISQLEISIDTWDLATHTCTEINKEQTRL
jgi:hypothetical protein